MSDDGASLEEIAAHVLDRGLESVWSRLGPLSVGAVASSAVIVASGVLARRLFDLRGVRGLKWLGVATLVPLGLWLLAGRRSPAPAEESAAPEEGAGRVGGRKPQEVDIEQVRSLDVGGESA